jgi:hypothetical protein
LVFEARGLTRYRREHVGFVFQFYNLIPSLTARENVALVTEIAHPPPLAPEEALRLVGLEQRMDHFPARLSGGEQQRVAIARAIRQAPGCPALRRAHRGAGRAHGGGGALAGSRLPAHARLVNTQREQIAMLKAFGYGNGAVTLHYVKLVLAITLLAERGRELAALPVGFLIGQGMAAYMIETMQSELFRIPYVLEARTYAFPALVVLVASTLSAPIAGYLRRITLEVGDPVTGGQVVATLEPLRSTSLDPRSRAEAQARRGCARRSSTWKWPAPSWRRRAWDCASPAPLRRDRRSRSWSGLRWTAGC